MSQSPNMIKGDLPPNSKDTFLILLTAALIRKIDPVITGYTDTNTANKLKSLQ